MKTRLILTSGDIDGIGLEVAIKALQQWHRPRSTQVLILCSSRTPLAHLRWAESQLQKQGRLRKVVGLQSALSNWREDFILMCAESPPALWVEWGARECLALRAQALVTGPLSKPSIQAAGLKDLGHTDILQRLCRTGPVHMGFVGEHFAVVLATGHLPLKFAEAALTPALHWRAILHADWLRQQLPRRRSQRPLGLLGMNPHCGDQGLIGKFDMRRFPTILTKSQKHQLHCVGPLVPDVAFQAVQWKQHSVYVACYHDQGLIPFKMAHGFDGVHLTLGLPIVRTSVDHGTAQDIFGQNKANPASMLAALQWGQRLTSQKQKGPAHV